MVLAWRVWLRHAANMLLEYLFPDNLLMLSVWRDMDINTWQHITGCPSVY